MPSERTRRILPYISIGVGILVYVLYYNSTQNWNETIAEYERQQVEEKLAKKRANAKYVAEAKPWVSADGKKVYKIVKREEKDDLIWIQLTELNENITYNLRETKAASGEKYTSMADNLFWIKGEEAIFENDKGVKYNLRETQIFRGLYSYMADANSYKLCKDDKRVSIAFLGDNMAIEEAYSKIGRPGENVYLEVEGAMIKEMSMEGDAIIDAVYPHKLMLIKDRKTCK